MKEDRILQEFTFENGRGTPGIYSMKRDKVLQEFTYVRGRGTLGLHL